MYNIKQHHDYRVYIIRGAAFGLTLCARALSPSADGGCFTHGFLFLSGTLRRTKDKSNLRGRIHCEGTQNRQLVHFKFHKCTKQGLPRGFETQLMERVLTALGGGSRGAAGTKSQPSWDSLLLEGPRSPGTVPWCIHELEGEYRKCAHTITRTNFTHALYISPCYGIPFHYLSTVLWDYSRKLLVPRMLLRSTVGYSRKEGKTFIVFVTDFGFNIIGNTAVTNIPRLVCNTNWSPWNGEDDIRSQTADFLSRTYSTLMYIHRFNCKNSYQCVESTWHIGGIH